MAKASQKKRKSEEEEIKQFLGALTDELVKKKVEEASKHMEMSKATIHAMKRKGSGSAVTFVKLLKYALDLEQDDLDYFVSHISEIAESKLDKPRVSRKILKELEKYMDENELIWFLNLGLAKVRMEAEMGTREKPKPPIKVITE